MDKRYLRHSRRPVLRIRCRTDPINLRREYLEHTLEISTHGDSSVYLLNPKVVGTDSEWEAWFFANWSPGADRYRSFAEMMLAHHEGFQSKGLDGF